MKILSREAIQRMITDRVGSGGGGSSSGGGSSVDMNFVSFDYWNQIFVVHGTQTVEVTDGTSGTVTTTTTDVTLPPNTLPSTTTETDETTGDVTVTTITITEVQVNYDFYSNGANSALGAASPGSGGGSTGLGDLLSAMNSLEVPSSAGTYVLNVTSNGVVTLVSESGGGGTTSGITLAQMWASLTNSSSDDYASTKIATAHIPYLSSLYYDSSTTLANKLSNYLLVSNGMNFTKSSNAVDARFYSGGSYDDTRMAAAHNYYIEWYSGDDYGWMNHAMGHIILADSSNQIWANTSGTVKFNLPSSSGTLALTSQIPSLTGYATQSWVSSQGYLTSETYRGTVTSVAMTVPTGFSISGTPITSSGTLALTFASGYSLPTTAKQEEWDDAYGWGDHEEAGYLKIVQGMKFLGYNSSYIAARFMNVDGTYDSTRASLAQGDGYIEWWSSGGYFNHQLGNLEAKGNVEVGTSTTDTTHYLQVGGAKLMWDNSSRSLYVIGADGNACNFYSSGGNSALGIPTSSTTSLNSLSIGTLTVTGNQTIGGTLTVTDTLTASGNVSVSGTLSGVVSATTLQVGSGTTISNIYWTGTQLRFYIGGNYYYFTPD